MPNLSAYIDAGYVPIFYCLERAAREYAERDLGMKVRLVDSVYEVNIGGEEVGDMWVDSGLCYEDGILFRRR